MGEISWLRMLKFQQELRHFSRALLVHGQKLPLTASEMELLSLLYLQPEGSTPLELSRHTGMKKEAVSRCLRQLAEKHLIAKSKRPEDERSYLLSLTETGRKALKESYLLVLHPLYELHENMGDEFEELFRLIETANIRMKQLLEES